MEFILEHLTVSLIYLIETSGYIGIIFLMALESANIPVPSEIVMPFSGFLSSRGSFNFWLVVLAGSIGNLLGSGISYEIGLYGGRPFLKKWGRFLFITQHDLAMAESWFTRYGSWAIFISRMLPVVRTFISFPAGIVAMDRKRFLALTFLGAVPWNIALTYIGFIAGENWQKWEGYFRSLSWLIITLLVLAMALWIWRHFKMQRINKF